MKKLNTSIPKSGPFQEGDKIQYLGKSETWAVENGKRIPIISPGMIVTVVASSEYGYQGTGRIIDEDEEGPLYDETHDHVSVYENEFGQRRCISREDKKNWKIV